MRTTTEKLVAALHVLANDIQSDDGVANATILEAAVRLGEQKQRIQSLIAERDTARAQADHNWKLRREFESLLGTSDITTGIGIVKTLIQASQDNVELRQQVKEQKGRIKRLAQSCVAKDEQLCNLLEICRSNGIEVSSQDLINGREEA